MTLPSRTWEIIEDFSTDPTTRGWVQFAPGSDDWINWRSTEQAVGANWPLTYYNNHNRYTKSISSRTQGDDIAFRLKIEHTGILVPADYGNYQMGLFKSSSLLTHNKLIMYLGRRSYPYPPADDPNHGFFIQVADAAGNLYTSSPSNLIIKDADFPITFFVDVVYAPDTKTVTMDIYDSSENFIEQLSLVLPPSITFSLDEIGGRTKDFGTNLIRVMNIGFMREFYFGTAFPPFVGQSFRVLFDGNEFPNWTSFNFGGSIRSLRGLGMNVPNPQGKNTSKFHVNQQIEIQFKSINEPSYRTVYKGYIDHPTSNIQGQNGQIVLSARDAGTPLTDEKCVDEDWTPYLSLTGIDPFDVCTFIVSNLKTQLLISGGSQRNEVPTPLDYDFNRSDWCIDVINKMAEYGGYEWFITYEGKFLMRPPKELVDANISKVFILGTRDEFTSLPNDNIAYILTENVGEDGTDIVNSLGLQGKDRFVFSEDTASVNAFRLRHEYFEDTNLESDHLQQIADRMRQVRQLSRRSFSIVCKGTFEIDRGDVVYIDDRTYGFSSQPSKLFRIVGKTDNVSKEGFITTLQLADIPLKVSKVMNLF